MQIVFSSGFHDLLRDLPTDSYLQHRTLTLLAEGAKARAQEKATGGLSNSEFLIARSGDYYRAIETTVGVDDATLSVTHPGATLIEFGGTVRPVVGEYLTFRLHNPTDTDQATGEWVRVRETHHKPRRIIEKSMLESLDDLPLHVLRAFQERGWM